MLQRALQLKNLIATDIFAFHLQGLLSYDNGPCFVPIIVP